MCLLRKEEIYVHKYKTETQVAVAIFRSAKLNTVLLTMER